VLGAFIQALFWTGGLLVGMGRNAQKNDEWEKWRTEATAADRIHDSYGSKIENNISALARHEQRLDKAESQLAKIDVMASQISRIETDVHDLKQQHNGNK
jgi:hypothetical protein